MGIYNLLQELSDIQTKRHISEYTGKRIGIDSYCWLHDSVYEISDIIDKSNSQKCLSYLKDRLNIFITNGITPVMVFDGDKLQMKKRVEAYRDMYIY